MHPRALWLALSAASLALLAVQDQDRTPAPVVAGKPAPAFRLNDHAGAAVSVGGPAKTWTVLAFDPKAATPG